MGRAQRWWKRESEGRRAEGGRKQKRRHEGGKQRQRGERKKETDVRAKQVKERGSQKERGKNKKEKRVRKTGEGKTRSGQIEECMAGVSSRCLSSSLATFRLPRSLP